MQNLYKTERYFDLDSQPPSVIDEPSFMEDIDTRIKNVHLLSSSQKKSDYSNERISNS